MVLRRGILAWREWNRKGRRNDDGGEVLDYTIDDFTGALKALGADEKKISNFQQFGPFVYSAHNYIICIIKKKLQCLFEISSRPTMVSLIGPREYTKGGPIHRSLSRSFGRYEDVSSLLRKSVANEAMIEEPRPFNVFRYLGWSTYL